MAWSVSCSTPPTTATDTGGHPVTSVPPATTTTAASVALQAMGRMCIAPEPPAEWSAKLATRPLQTSDGVAFGLGLPGDGGVVIGQYNSAAESGIGQLSVDGLTKIVQYGPDVSGLAAMAMARSWVAWTQGESATNMSNWTLRVWNRDTRTSTTVASSRQPDGSFVAGQQPIPVVRDGLLAWAQPTGRTAGVNESEVRVLDLASGRVSTVASGRVSNPVFAGSWLVWGRRAQDGAYSFEAVDSMTLQKVELPAALRNPGSIAHLTGSARYLAWSAEGLLKVTVWEIGGSRGKQYDSPDIKHYLQFLQLAGHYLLWYGGITSSILDLETGAAFDVVGSVGGSEGSIAVEQPSATVSKGAFASSRVSVVSMTDAPGVPKCSP